MTDQSGKRWEDTRKAWEEVGQQFAEVGRHLERRYRSMEQEKSGAATGEPDVGEALDDVVHRLDQALTSVGDTLRDHEAKETLQRAVRSFGDALAATFSEVGDRIKGRIGSQLKNHAGPAADPASGPDRPH